MAKRITDELLVSRAEHNEGNLTNLEEISLHQQHLGKLEYINRVCGHLKILYLQDNCIGKIENLGRMRSLEHLNLALNNVELIENLECCEFLKKLDLTLNFVGNLSRSVENLKGNVQLRDLILMGNPCCKFQHYRDFVVASLPQLHSLDCEDISKAERISACQRLLDIAPEIQKQEVEYEKTRKLEKVQVLEEISSLRKEYEDASLDGDEQRRRFFKSKSRHAPEYKLEASRKMSKYEEEDRKARDPFREEDEAKKKAKNVKRFFNDSGKPLNINQANIDFRYDDGDAKDLKVELFLFKHLDTSLIDLDVQPNFLRATIKGKVFQLRFLEEVRCDQSKAERSQTTGHLVIIMPKSKPSMDPLKLPSDSFHQIGEKSENVQTLNNVEQGEEIPPLEEVFE